MTNAIMRFKRICRLMAALAFALCAAAPALAQGRNLIATIKAVRPSVVGIATFQAIRQPQIVMAGTGFVVGDGHYAITNHHVIEGKTSEQDKEYLVVTIGRGSDLDVRPVDVVARDPDHDLALLKFGGGKQPALKHIRTDVEPVEEGTAVAITGFPIGAVLGQYPVTHHGIISAVTPLVAPQATARSLTVETIMRQRFDVYQLDMVAYPGNSGSPLYEADTGRLIGVLNSTFVKETREHVLSTPSGISFAIPSAYVAQLMRRAGLKTE